MPTDGSGVGLILTAREAVPGRGKFRKAFRMPGLVKAMLRWTALYWVAVYVMFTLRSIANPRPHLEVQAGLRVIMMLIGFALSMALLGVLRRLGDLDWPRRIGFYALLGGIADLVYMLINYLVFYAIPGLWVPEHGPVAKIGSYVVELFWLFPTWLLIYELESRRQASEAGGGPPATDNLWIGSRGNQVRIPVDEIDRIDSEGDYVRIHTRGRSFLQRSTMAKMEATLDPTRFIRVHRGTMVALQLVKAIKRRRDGRMILTLMDGSQVGVGRSYARRVTDRARSLKDDGAGA